MKKGKISHSTIEYVESEINKCLKACDSDIFYYGNHLDRFNKNGKLYIDEYIDMCKIYGQIKNEIISIQYLKDQSTKVNIANNKYGYYKELIYTTGENDGVKITVYEKQNIVDYDKHILIGKICKDGTILYDKDNKLVSENISERWGESSHKLSKYGINYKKDVIIHNIDDEAYLKKMSVNCSSDSNQNIERYFISTDTKTDCNVPGKHIIRGWHLISKEKYNELINENKSKEEKTKVKKI